LTQEQADNGIATRGEIPDVLAALERSDFAAAFQLADSAIRRGATEPVLFNARAMYLQEKGRYAEALGDFECVRAFFPRDPALLNSIGHCLFRLGQFQRAIAALDLSISIQPDSAPAHHLRALALESIAEPEAAQRAMERVISLQPDHVEAIMGLANIMTKKGRMGEASELAKRALSLDPGRPDAIVVLARCDSEAGNFTEVEQRVRASLDNPEIAGTQRLALMGLLADALDRQGSPGEAFALYEAANEECRLQHAPVFAVGRAIDNVLGIVSYFERSNAWMPSTPVATSAGAPQGHVFLLGFMRSGTTLLESIVGSHPRTVAIDESDFLRDAAQIFLGSDDGLDRLAGLGNENIARWRGEYWQAVHRKAGSVAGKLFLDKLPFNSVKLPLIARLFPDARVLFAIRDPRDVVLSAFRNRFAIHPDSFEFLRLADCARYYAAVMRLAELCFQKLPLRHHHVRYEDVIDNFAVTIESVCKFCDIDWDESMRDFRRGVRNVDIGSVSAPQVRRGLYRGAVGQWRSYRHQMEPVLPILQPWIEKLGYPQD
jgi:tetratricopeptide (TPR) repeat protein